MNDLLALSTHLSAALTGALVSAIWQGALLVAFVALFLRLFPRLSAAARSVIWLNVFALLAVLHLLPLLGPASQVAPGHAFPPSVAQAIQAHALQIDPRWSLAVALLWLAASAYRAIGLLTGAVHVVRLARRAIPVHRPDLAPAVNDLLNAPGQRRALLCASAEVARPSVLGLVRPRILMPPDLLETLSPAELRQVLLHEMEHLRRYDDWSNLLQKLALVLFPLNPALFWVERRLCAERELACDDRVLQAGSRKAYALCLAHLAEHSMLRRGYALVLGAWENRPELIRRIERIISSPTRAMSRTTAFATSGALVAGALSCALILARTPELVRFAPAEQQARSLAPRTLAPIDPQALGLAGTPHLARAAVPAQPHPVAVHSLAVKAHRAVRRPAPAIRLADLRTPPPAAGEMLVMTEWTEALPDRVVIAVAQPQPVRVVPRAQSVRVVATYAIATPNGWLFLQI